MSSNPLFDRQRSVHWAKPTWFEKEKREDGTWSKVPHYGKVAQPEKKE